MLQKLSRLLEIADHPLTLSEQHVGHTDETLSERLIFETATGERVGGFLMRPRLDGPRPAILYIHAHGDRYEIGAGELLHGRPALQGSLGPVFAAMGFVTLAIDMPAFGSRATPGESTRTKERLWRGRSLAGQMVGELASALDWLTARPDVDEARIGAFGISMGATLGYWLAAVDSRVSCLAQLCCFADFDALIAAGAHDLHGIYLTVPGLLDVASNGEIAGLMAPRPQLICIGDRDPLTPPDAVDIALSQTTAAYVAAGKPGNLQLHREVDTGHQESPAMRRVMLDFFRRNLGDSPMTD